MTKIFSVLDTEIHDHYIIIGVFAAIILVTYLNVNHNNVYNCHVLEPTIDCSFKGFVTRDAIQANGTANFVYIDHSISLYGKDEYRGIAPSTFHAECNVGSPICQYHYDTYNGVVSPLNTFDNIGHVADTLSTLCWGTIQQGISYDCRGIPDFWSVLIIWSTIIFGGYYGIKHTVLFIRSRLS